MEDARQCLRVARTRDGRSPISARVDLVLDLAIGLLRAASDGKTRVRVATREDEARMADEVVPPLIAFFLDGR